MSVTQPSRFSGDRRTKCEPAKPVFHSALGHHHTRLDAEIAGVRCIGLNKVAMPGNLVTLDVPARGRGFEILGEWSNREPVTPRPQGKPILPDRPGCRTG